MLRPVRHHRVVEITVLGTSSPYPRPDDPCSSFLLTAGDTRIWVDAGSGTLGPLLASCRLEDLDAAWISHTHADHFADLTVAYYALLYADITRPPLPVLGPPGWAERLRAFLSHAGPSPIEAAFDVHEVHDGWAGTIGEVQVRAHQMHHDALCHGLRAQTGGQVVAYTGDTGPCAGLTEVAAGADLLISEAGYGLDRSEADPVHLTAGQAGAAAAEAGARHLLLTHLAGADVDACVRAAGDAGAARVTGARPGARIPVQGS